MTTRRNIDEQPLPLDVVRTLDALCDEFESAMAAGDLPPLEPLLDRVPPVGRRPLLEELVAIAAESQTHRDKELTRARLLEENPELAAELLSVFDNEDAITIQVEGDPIVTGSPGLSVRCPNCHNPIMLSPDAELESIECPSCGSDFSLVGGAEATRAATAVTEVGHFKLVERVGLGGFGSVWKAHDTRLDRTVAVKIPRKGQFDEKQERAFLREAQSAAQLNHPGIVTLYELGSVDGRAAIDSSISTSRLLISASSKWFSKVGKSGVCPA
jgi:ribosomal protein S27E